MSSKEKLSPAATDFLAWILQVAGTNDGVFDVTARIMEVDAINWVRVMQQLSIELGCNVEYTSYFLIKTGDPAEVTITH